MQVDRKLKTSAVSLAGTCPVCLARPNENCHVPSNHSRRYVTWFHHGRYEAGLAEMTRKNEKEDDDDGR